MGLQKFFIYTSLALFMGFAVGNGRRHQKHHKRPVTYPTIYVDPTGHSNFSTIQAAIDHVPAYNKNWICIYIKAGEYREQISIPFNKPFIYLKGEGKWKTRVVWDAHDSIATSATFTSHADNIVAKSLTFMNSYNYPPEKSNNPIRVALAAMISGDKSSFYRCGFLGFQDTLWDVQGRHYFKLCTIQGAVDFIFGAAQSIYERCTISVVAGVLDGLAGFITAQARMNPSDTNGFVFKDCNVMGTGVTFLGRPWRDYARVIFYNSSLSDIVVPEGWSAWGSVGREYQLTFAEHGCYGLGSDTSKRVKWEYQLSEETLGWLTSISFVDDEGWISSQPFNMLV